MTWNNDPIDEFIADLVEEVGTGGVADIVEASAEDEIHAQEIYDQIINVILPPEADA